jgi:glycosyltransferase involved in cell wall biosynthesis
MVLRISAIIPCYNRADLIGETLRSVLGQTRPPHEVIVVDDGSSDGSADVVGTFGASVKLIRQANAGAGAARNAGFAASSGDIVHFMDSDDLSSLNSYTVAAAAIEAGADMTYGPWLKTRFDGTRLDPEPVALQQGPVPGPMDLLVLAMKWVTVFQPCFFRRSLIEQVGPYRTDLKPSEDTELLYRILVVARAPVHTPETLVLYRVHPENQVSEQNLAGRLIDQANLWKVLQEHLDRRGDVDAAFRAEFRRRKFQAAHEVRAYDPTRATALGADARWLEQGLRPLRRFVGRAQNKLLRMRAGHPYGPYLAPAPLTDGQREQVRLLGYTLPGTTSSSSAAIPSR